MITYELNLKKCGRCTIVVVRRSKAQERHNYFWLSGVKLSLLLSNSYTSKTIDSYTLIVVCTHESLKSDQIKKNKSHSKKTIRTRSVTANKSQPNNNSFSNKIKKSEKTNIYKCEWMNIIWIIPKNRLKFIPIYSK